MQGQLNVIEFSPPDDISALVGAGELSASFMLSILNASPDCIKIIETDGTVSFMNQNGLYAMEIENFAHTANREWCDLWPQESQDLIKQAVERAKAGEVVRLNAFCPTSKGAPKWWDVCVSPVLYYSGKAVRVLSILRDISALVSHEDQLRQQDLQLKAGVARQAEILEQKNALLKEQDLLLREIDHRVKNSLAMTAGILRLQMRKTDNPDAKMEISEAANRVMTISKVHERLYQDKGLSRVQLKDYLVPLCEEIFESIATGNVKLKLDIASVALSADIAVSLGLLTAELLSNSLRHGFDDYGGELKISFSALPGERYLLSVIDNGIGLPDEFDLHQGNGLGMKIVEIYTDRLGGTIAFQNNEIGGARFDVSFDGA